MLYIYESDIYSNEVIETKTPYSEGPSILPITILYKKFIKLTTEVAINIMPMFLAVIFRFLEI